MSLFIYISKPFIPPTSIANPEKHQRLGLVWKSIGDVLNWVVNVIQVEKSTFASELSAIITTFDLSAPHPSLSVSMWKSFVLVLAGAMEQSGQYSHVFSGSSSDAKVVSEQNVQIRELLNEMNIDWEGIEYLINQCTSDENSI